MRGSRIRKLNLTVVALVLLLFVFSSGCTESISSPENILKEYVSYFNEVRGDNIYDLLSNDLKKSYSKDQTNNIVYAKRQNYQISDYKIIEKIVSENITTLKVDITWDIEGIHITKNYNIEFVFEDDEWKSNSDIIRYSP